MSQRLSVVMPTYNEAARVGRCLDALFAQPADGLEVIVADDGSTDGTPDVIAGRFPGVRLLRLAHRGSAAAREAGFRAARAPRIASLDADCQPCPGWADAAAAAEPDAAPVMRMGRVIAEPTARSRLLALLEFGEFLGSRPGPLRNFAFLNLSGPAEVFRREHVPLVRFGSDRLYSWQLIRRGIPIRFDPAQAVVHAPDTGLAPLLRRHWSYARRFVENRRREPDLPGGRLARAGPVATPILAAGRLFRDVQRLVRSRAELGIAAAALPAYAAALAGCRFVDVLAMLEYGLTLPRLPAERRAP